MALLGTPQRLGASRVPVRRMDEQSYDKGTREAVQRMSGLTR